ncbi:MAG: alanine racemase [Defluviitaleaceae bacterium]|nr:alanine racemase [Defluviitaleaceae bacterium]
MTENLRNWAEIDLDNLAHNVIETKKFVGDTNFMAVVKAEAYGHGSIEISKVVLENGASSLGVATLDEAIKLRQNGITAPILVLAPTMGISNPLLLEHNISQAIATVAAARELSQAAVAVGKTAVIHIKIDSGLGRIGFKTTPDTVQKILEIDKLPGIKMEGIFTHLAVSETRDTSYTQEQYKNFLQVTQPLKNAGLNLVEHISASGAILSNPEMNMGMVRPGALLYGVYTSDEIPTRIDLRPVMVVRGRIAFLNHIAKGESVGYSRTYFASRPTTIGILIYGYADGYPSKFSNKSHVSINGIKCPVVGRVCMDQLLVDVTDVPNVGVGDIADIIGGDGPSAFDLTNISDVTTREVQCLTNIGKRVPRVYYKNSNPYKCEYL